MIREIYRKIFVVFFTIIGSNAFVSAATFVVMTCNVRRKGSESKSEYLWENRQEALVQFFKEKKVDILGLQEPIKEQVTDIARDLGDTFAWAGEGRGSVWMGFDTNEYNPIFYNKNMFELKDSGTFRVNKPWWHFFWAPSEVAILPRICTWVLLREKNGEKCFYVYNTHLDHNSDAARKHAMEVIFDEMQKHKKQEKYPIIFLGDLNTTLTKEYKELLGDHQLKNAYTVAEEKGQLMGTHKLWKKDDEKSDEQIDYIFVSNEGFAVKKYEILVAEKIISDHRPVIAEVELT
ncbi:MAG TPA: endonuclease/exonuclease/phosphatase family protein [Candidatus Bathyarchaeia archaeon]|nr:endonuclease/exonuclease/phosphatase family protein [Candidatus Bathyarchaeia archaeon]